MASQKPAPPAQAVRPLDTLGVGLMLLCCAIWGVNQVALKSANEGIPPLLQAGWRGVLCSLLICGWMLYRGLPILVRDGTLWPGILSGLAFAGNFLFIGPGLSLTEVSRGVLFLYTAPFFVAIGAHLFIPGDRLTPKKAAGFMVAFAGLMVSVSERMSGGLSSPSLLGDFYCLLAGFFWALTTLIIRTTSLRDISPERNLLYELVVSAPILFAASYLVGERAIGPLTGPIVGWFAYTVVVVVFFSYLLWMWMLSVYVVSQLSVFTFLGPIFAVIAGHLLLDEPITWRLAAALALVAAGIYLVNRPVQRP